jgi:uncharacterized protein YjbI with pentapeptide repeats
MVDVYNEELANISKLEAGTYESCVFNNCDFSNTHLMKVNWIDCRFINCELSNASLVECKLQDVIFEDCKLLGVDFSSVNSILFDAIFRESNLSFAQFVEMKPKHIRCESCNLTQADFTMSDLTECEFLGCNMEGVTFDQTILTKVDMSNSFAIWIDLDLNIVDRMKISKDQLPGLLQNFNLEIV